MNDPSRKLPDTRALHVIRVALLLSPLVFGAFVWYYHGDSPTPRVEAAGADAISAVFLVVALAAGATLFAIRAARERTDDFIRRVSLSVIGWAAGESAGIFGAVVYFLTADRLPFLIGLALVFIAMMLIPVPVPRDPER